MDSYGVVNPNNATIPGFQPNMRVAYSTDGAAVYRPMMPPPPPFQGAGNVAGPTPPSQAKKRRGRPRKYEVEGGSTMSPLPLQAAPRTEVGFSSGGGGDEEDGGGERRGRAGKGAVEGGGVPPPPSQLEAIFQASGLSSSPALMGASSSSAGKKVTGRPKGAKGKKKERVADMGSTLLGFMPHVMIVAAGEDISARIMSFSENGTRALCVLSANGSVSNVTLRQLDASGGTVTYEGRFDIIRLTGPDMVIENGGQRRTGRFSVTLTGPDGRLFGGSVAGVLTAATPVQVVFGCTSSGEKNLKSPTHAGGEDIKSPTEAGPSTAPPNVVPAGPSTAPPNVVPGASAAGSPISWGTMSDSSGGHGSPLNENTGAYNDGGNQQDMNSLSWLN